MGAPRWDETARNKEEQGEKDKDIEKEETENTRKIATILWLSLRAIFNHKTGHILRNVCLFWAHQVRLQPYIYMYMYIYIISPWN